MKQCPKCEGILKKNKEGIIICTECGAKFRPKSHNKFANADSMPLTSKTPAKKQNNPKKQSNGKARSKQRQTGYEERDSKDLVKKILLTVIAIALAATMILAGCSVFTWLKEKDKDKRTETATVENKDAKEPADEPETEQEETPREEAEHVKPSEYNAEAIINSLNPPFKITEEFPNGSLGITYDNDNIKVEIASESPEYKGSVEFYVIEGTLYLKEDSNGISMLKAAGDSFSKDSSGLNVTTTKTDEIASTKQTGTENIDGREYDAVEVALKDEQSLTIYYIDPEDGRCKYIKTVSDGVLYRIEDAQTIGIPEWADKADDTDEETIMWKFMSGIMILGTGNGNDPMGSDDETGKAVQPKEMYTLRDALGNIQTARIYEDKDTGAVTLAATYVRYKDKNRIEKGTVLSKDMLEIGLLNYMSGSREDIDLTGSFFKTTDLEGAVVINKPEYDEVIPEDVILAS